MIRLLSKIACAGLLAWALPASAQESTDPAPPSANQFGPRKTKPAATRTGAAPEVIATHGDWKITCETGAQGKKACGMVLSARSEKQPKAGLTVVVVKAKNGEKMLTMMRIMAPIGVYLPTGIALEIDGAAVGRLPFVRCGPKAPVCEAFAEAEPGTVEKFKKGTAANFIIYEAPGVSLPIKVSLAGFSKALDALGGL